MYAFAVASVRWPSTSLARRAASGRTPAGRFGGHRRCRVVASATEGHSVDETRERRARKVLAGLALVGATETTVLTLGEKILTPNRMCPTKGCIRVLASPFALLFNVPLTTWGLLAYSVFASLALFPLWRSAVARRKKNDLTPEASFEKWRARTSPLLVSVSSIMATFSGYLMFVLFRLIRGFCPWCVFSACMSFTIFGLVLSGRLVRTPSMRERVPVVMMSLVLAILLARISMRDAAQTDYFDSSVVYAPPIVKTRSTRRTKGLAKHLAKQGAKMYGTFFCVHCHWQKEQFGKEAWGLINYIECGANGVSSEYEDCFGRGFKGYPCWEIDGRLYPGAFTLQDLAEKSGYKGPLDSTSLLPPGPQ